MPYASVDLNDDTEEYLVSAHSMESRDTMEEREDMKVRVEEESKSNSQAVPFTHKRSTSTAGSQSRSSSPFHRRAHSFADHHCPSPKLTPAASTAEISSLCRVLLVESMSKRRRDLEHELMTHTGSVKVTVHAVSDRHEATRVLKNAITESLSRYDVVMVDGDEDHGVEMSPGRRGTVDLIRLSGYCGSVVMLVSHKSSTGDADMGMLKTKSDHIIERGDLNRIYAALKGVT